MTPCSFVDEAEKINYQINKHTFFFVKSKGKFKVCLSVFFLVLSLVLDYHNSYKATKLATES